MFEYLERFVVATPPSGAKHDYFIQVPVKDIQQAERQLGFPFPPQLRRFYELIGSGNYVGRLAKGPYGALCSNEILHPRDVVEIYQGGGVYPFPLKLRRGELPFFRLVEDKYLTMYPAAAKPDAVYFMPDIVVANHLDHFLRRLLDDPEFYDFVITAWWAKREREAAKRKKKAAHGRQRA